MREGQSNQNDRLLWPYLQATETDDSQRLLDELILDIGLPIIRRILRGYEMRPALSCQGKEPSDAEQDVALILLEHLRTVKESCPAKHINSFADYVAVVTYNYCHDLARKSNDSLYRLKRQVYYTFKTTKGLARWRNSEGLILCGFDDWRGAKSYAGASVSKDISERITEQLAASRYHVQNVRELPLPVLLSLILHTVGKPMRLKEMVSLVAHVMGLRGKASREFEFDETIPGEGADEESKPVELIDNRQILAPLWSEIKLLPKNQVKSLLFGMRDANGRSLLAVFELTGVADPEEVAAILEISTDELERLGRGRRLKDEEIAVRLGLGPQQVRNLRSSARKRLLRRMGTYKDNLSAVAHGN